MRWVAALLLALPLALGATPAAACGFVLGFAQIRAAIGPGVVGDCIEDEHANPANGDTLQRTTSGLLVWRRADNWTAFTDGYRTWVNGPRGLQVRLNTESFDWERAASSGLRAADVAVPPRFRVGRFAQPRQLVLPAGFGASMFAAGLTAPRGMAVGPTGDVYVTGLRPGRVYRLPDRDGDSAADGVDVFVGGLTTPHGIAVRDGYLYVAEQGQIVRFQLGADGERAGDAEVVVDGLPIGGNHVTRSIAFAPDGRLYVAAGSSCNVCEESDPRRGAIWRYGPGGGEPFARGLRNAVGLTIRPGTDELWAVNNGRDNLGDDLPPETLYQVREGMDAGWPRCLATGAPDPDLGGGVDCGAIERPLATFPAHSAPLGLRFYDGALFPAEYRGSLFVALHGSWNRSSPIGYEVVQVPFEGGRPGSPRPFAGGFLPASGLRADVWARPVDLVVARDGALLISDDDGGAIVRIAPVR